MNLGQRQGSDPGLEDRQSEPHEDAAGLREKIVAALAERFGAELRA